MRANKEDLPSPNRLRGPNRQCRPRSSLYSLVSLKWPNSAFCWTIPQHCLSKFCNGNGRITQPFTQHEGNSWTSFLVAFFRGISAEKSSRHDVVAIVTWFLHFLVGRRVIKVGWGPGAKRSEEGKGDDSHIFVGETSCCSSRHGKCNAALNWTELSELPERRKLGGFSLVEYFCHIILSVRPNNAGNEVRAWFR